jgi:hypothetical protein
MDVIAAQCQLLRQASHEGWCGSGNRDTQRRKQQRSDRLKNVSKLADC